MKFETLLIWGVSGVLPWAVIIYMFCNPEKIEKWSVLIFKAWYFLTRKGSKSIVKHDIQGRINDFSKVLEKQIANHEPVKIEIEWVDKKSEIDDFFKENKLVVRMRHHDDQNKNFVIAAMTFISRSVLPKTKKYLSKLQKESIDLYIGRKLCRKEKPSINAAFFDEYFEPKTDSSQRIKELLEKYGIIDRVGIFYPVLIQELGFLGQKVFMNPKSQKIIEEVTLFVNFLEKYAQREVGDDSTETKFGGNYCRCGIVIIAKRFKAMSGDIKPYVNYIQTLVERKIENIYILGSADAENHSFIEKIADEVQSQFGYLEYDNRIFDSKTKKDDNWTTVKDILILLRSPEVIDFYDSELQDQLITD